MAYLQHPMLLHLLEQIEFDTETGCWFGPDGTFYHGRAIWFLWFGWNKEDYHPSRICAPRYYENDICPCISPFHVEKEWMMGEALAARQVTA